MALKTALADIHGTILAGPRIDSAEPRAMKIADVLYKGDVTNAPETHQIAQHATARLGLPVCA
jgi:hypothetical protein